MVSKGDEFLGTDPFRFHNGASTGKIRFENAYLHAFGHKISGTMDALTDTDYQKSFAVLSEYKKSFDVLPAGNAFSFVASIPPIGNYASRSARVTIFTKDNHNGSTRAEFESIVTVFSKVNGTNSWVVNQKDTLTDPADWNSVPTVSVTDNGDGTGTLQIAGEQSSASAYGKCSVSWL